MIKNLREGEKLRILDTWAGSKTKCFGNGEVVRYLRTSCVDGKYYYHVQANDGTMGNGLAHRFERYGVEFDKELFSI